MRGRTLLGLPLLVSMAAMTPQPRLASTGYCLACAGMEYLIYQPLAGEGFFVELAAGTYRFEWFDAAKGQAAGGGTVQANGGAYQFKAPFAGDAVLYLKQAKINE